LLVLEDLVGFLLLVELVAAVVNFSNLSTELSHVPHHPAQRVVGVGAAFQVYLAHEILDVVAGGDSLPAEAALRGVVAGPRSLGERSGTFDERAPGGQHRTKQQTGTLVEAALGIVALREEAGGLALAEPIANVL